MVITKNKIVTLVFSSLLVAFNINYLSNSFSKASVAPNNHITKKTKKLKTSRNGSINSRLVKSFHSVSLKTNTSFQKSREKNTYSNTSIIVNGDNSKTLLGFNFDIRGSFYNDNKKLTFFTKTINKNSSQNISVANQKLLDLEVKTKLGPVQKWAKVDIIKNSLVLNMNTVDPTSLKFEINAKGHWNNSTISLSESYKNRDNQNQNFVLIGNYGVYNMNNASYNWLFKTSIGIVTFSLLFILVLSIVSIALIWATKHAVTTISNLVAREALETISTSEGAISTKGAISTQGKLVTEDTLSNDGDVWFDANDEIDTSSQGLVNVDNPNVPNIVNISRSSSEQDLGNIDNSVVSDSDSVISADLGNQSPLPLFAANLFYYLCCVG